MNHRESIPPWLCPEAQRDRAPDALELRLEPPRPPLREAPGAGPTDRGRGVVVFDLLAGDLLADGR